jgi:hypothetical protein
MLRVPRNPGIRSIYDLLLMAACKHNIIANSSFGWWGAWLDDHPGKPVIAPARWCNDRERDAAVELPPGWTRL